VFLANLNETSESLFDTAKRSFDRSPALFERTFRSFVEHSPEEKIGTYEFDLKRVKAMMTAVVQALHYRDQRQKWGHWKVFVPSLGSNLPLIQRGSPGWDSLWDLFSRIPYVERFTAEPKVFRYGSHALPDWGWVYRLIFYGGFVVNAVMHSEDPSDRAVSRQRQPETFELNR
jgi:hypothetical protein